MKKLKTALSFIFSICLLLGPSVGALNATTASADEMQSEMLDGTSSGTASTRGLYTSLSLSINGGDGKVWATVKNDITIFPSDVKVIVELYASETYYESYTDMELVCMNAIEDLNMGKTITAEASTGGVQKYWHGRMRYKIDNGAWESGTTGTLLYSADGTYLNIV